MALDVVPPLSQQPRPHSKVKGRRPCSCCPYGYHIDLDFVRYCESITNSQLMPSVSCRRSRWNNVRRKRASREALLGLVLKTPEPVHVESPSVVNADVGDDLRKAVLDFEKTLKHASLPRTKNIKDWAALDTHENVYSLPRNHTFQGTVLSSPTPMPRKQIKNERGSGNRVPSIEEMLFSNVETANTETLQEIREQIAASLQRMKELEKQIKNIPRLHDEIATLRVAKSQLMEELAQLKSVATKITPLQSDKLSSTRDLVHSRSVAVGCTVLTRDVGVVSPQLPSCRSVGVGSEVECRTRPDGGESVSLDKIIGAPSTYRANVRENLKLKGLTIVDKSTLTTIEQRSVGVMTESTMSADAFSENCRNRRLEEMNRRRNESPLSLSPSPSPPPPPPPIPLKMSRASNTVLRMEDICTLNDDDHETAVGSETSRPTKPVTSNAYVQTSKRPINKNVGLQIGVKSVDVGSMAKVKSISVAQQASALVRHIGIPDELLGGSFGCDKCSLEKMSVGTFCPDWDDRPSFDRSESSLVSKTTDTADLLIVRHEGTNTQNENLKSTGVETDDSSSWPSYSGQTSSKSTTAPSTPAKRPSFLPVSVHRTKSGSSPSPKIQSLQHEGSNSDSGSDDGTYTIHQDIGMRDDSSSDQSLKYQNYVRREPPKEMRGAMKVLNDALLKSQNGDIPKHVKTAVNIVQQEWFKVSSVAAANPLDVEYYLDCFEEISSTLLEYVVNMSDVSGNTAMHYAVSNGNFDVVSILLDSKVCNINKLNTAGYTCIMLVALSKVKSETDREVVRRLFQMADVNIRAKEHGQTALMLAVSHGRIDTVELLLEAGADINIQDEDGSTALMCAAEHGYIEIVKLLLAQPDCDLGITDNDGTTALAIAMEAGNRDIGVLLYAQEHFSRGSSPYTSLKHKRAKSTTPTLKSRPTTPSHSSHRKDSEIES